MYAGVMERDGRHVDALAAEPARVDLATRGDVEALQRRFYDQVLVDDILAEPFTEVRRNGLESHLPARATFGRPSCAAPGSMGAARCAYISPSMTGMRSPPVTSCAGSNSGTGPSTRCIRARSPNTRKSKRRESPPPCTVG